MVENLEKQPNEPAPGEARPEKIPKGRDAEEFLNEVFSSPEAFSIGRGLSGWSWLMSEDEKFIDMGASSFQKPIDKKYEIELIKISNKESVNKGGLIEKLKGK